MSEAIKIMSAYTEDLDEDTRTSIIHVCCTAHHEEDFVNLFSYIPSGGLHVLAYREDEVISHAVATTRWLQPDGLPRLCTAYIDAVATLPAYQGLGIGSAVMHQLASNISTYQIGCLSTDRITFYQRLGWEIWRGALAGRSGAELIPTPEQTGIMILQLPDTPPLDLDGLLVIESAGRIW